MSLALRHERQELAGRRTRRHRDARIGHVDDPLSLRPDVWRQPVLRREEPVEVECVLQMVGVALSFNVGPPELPDERVQHPTHRAILPLLKHTFARVRALDPFAQRIDINGPIVQDHVIRPRKRRHEGDVVVVAGPRRVRLARPGVAHHRPVQQRRELDDVVPRGRDAVPRVRVLAPRRRELRVRQEPAVAVPVHAGPAESQLPVFPG